MLIWNISYRNIGNVIFGVPVAVGTALFFSYYAPEWIKKPMVVLVDVMAAIPSIVFGLWGLLCFNASC
jgi:phosphate transport system permease protein